MRPRDLGIGKLFERIRDAAVVADAKSQRIFLWNQAATNIFGYSTSEALELHVEDLVPEYLKDQHRAGIARYSETGHGPYIDSPRLLELPALRKGGEEIYIELSLSPRGAGPDGPSARRAGRALLPPRLPRRVQRCYGPDVRLCAGGRDSGRPARRPPPLLHPGERRVSKRLCPLRLPTGRHRIPRGRPSR